MLTKKFTFNYKKTVDKFGVFAYNKNVKEIISMFWTVRWLFISAFLKGTKIVDKGVSCEVFFLHSALISRSSLFFIFKIVINSY